MNGITSWIKQHPYATGAIVLVGGLIFLLLRGKGSSAGASTSSAAGAAEQIAQIQAASNAQSAQVNGQVTAAQIAANAQTQAQDDALKAQEAQVVGSVAEYGLNYEATLAGYKASTDNTSIQAGVYKDLIDTAATEQASHDSLVGSALKDQYTAIDNIVTATANKGNNQSTVGANEVALLLNEGNIGSLNEANASTSIASSLSTASILKSISGAAGTIAGGLFG